ncbi:MAG: YjbH domain-containing protein [Bacteroidia bacterium]|nr:YjbH domain-containing protein [Bacteroidia bacterium]
MKKFPAFKTVRRIILAILITMTGFISLGNNDSIFVNNVTNILTSYGFRNVAVCIDNSQVIITYENYDYRFEPDALHGLIGLVLPEASKYAGCSNLIIIVQRQQTPFLCVSIPADRFHFFLQSDNSPEDVSQYITSCSNVEEYWKIIKQVPVTNTLISNFDISIEPQIGLQLGDYKYPFKYEFNLLPEITTSLWKGMSLKYQLIVPVFRNHFVDESYYVRPGLVTLNQLFRLPYHTISNMTLGYFTQNRYGADIELGRYFFRDRLFIILEGGITGMGTYLKKGSVITRDSAGIPVNETIRNAEFRYSAIDYFNCRATLNYWLPRYDLNAAVSYGRYLYYQDVCEVSFTRCFDEYIFSIRALYVDNAYNFGFGLSIPLYPAKYKSNKKLRIRPFNNISYLYYVKNEFAYLQDTGTNFEGWIKYFNPYYVKNQLKGN